MSRAFIVAAVAGLAFAAFAPAAGKAAPASGAFGPNVESNVTSVVCVRKTSGKIVCGYYDPYGNFHETGEPYGGGPVVPYGYGPGPYGGPGPGPYGGPGAYAGGCVCVPKSDGRVVCGFYDRYGGFHESKACYRY